MVVARGCVHVIDRRPGSSIVGTVEYKGLGATGCEIRILSLDLVTGDPERVGELPDQINVGQGALKGKPTVVAVVSIVLIEGFSQRIGGVRGGARTNGSLGSGGGAGHAGEIGGQLEGIFEGRVVSDCGADFLKVSPVGVGGSDLESHHSTGGGRTRDHARGCVDAHPTGCVGQTEIGWRIGCGDLIGECHTRGGGGAGRAVDLDPGLSDVSQSASVNARDFGIGKENVIEANVVQPNVGMISDIGGRGVVVARIVPRSKNQSRSADVDRSRSVLRGDQDAVGKDFSFSSAPDTRQVGPTGNVHTGYQRVVSARSS